MPKGRRQKTREDGIFDSIRKPTAPSSKRFGNAKREGRADPALRKAKHKKKERSLERDSDVQ